jgi:hypothetical protein
VGAAIGVEIEGKGGVASRVYAVPTIAIGENLKLII